MGTTGSQDERSLSVHPVIQPRPLGTTGLSISPMGLGTWAWGERFFWGYGRGYDKTDLEDVFRLAIEHGINFLDTAEVYGRGRSEQFIGEFARKYGVLNDLVIASKFFPYPWRWSARSLARALQGTLRRLGRDAVDIYYLHWPFPPRSPAYWLRAMLPAFRQGRIRGLGVSNVSLNQVQRLQRFLEAEGLGLTAVQVEYNLVYRHPEFSGLLDYCREQHIVLVAYSPLASGILTGKYGPDHPPRDWRRRRYTRAFLERLRPLFRVMEEIAAAHGKTLTQVALNWVMAKGAVPIPGAKNERQMRENLGALGWQLSPDEVDALDRVSETVQREPWWPRPLWRA